MPVPPLTITESPLSFGPLLGVSEFVALPVEQPDEAKSASGIICAGQNRSSLTLLHALRA
jgi:hypothetical protein